MSQRYNRVITWGAKISAAKKGIPGKRTTTAEDFWKRIYKCGDCWLWVGAVRNGGYGSLTFKLKRWDAHRLAWTLARGPIPDGKYVLHKCDVKTCINPEHLFIGTQCDNMADMKAKGRRKNIGTGESNGRAKLTMDAVDCIRKTFVRGRGSNTNSARLAEKFGVSPTMVQRIVNGRYWRKNAAV